jgi:hypothetical protein
MYRVTQKAGTLEKTSKNRRSPTTTILLTETEPLQLAF